MECYVRKSMDGDTISGFLSLDIIFLLRTWCAWFVGDRGHVYIYRQNNSLSFLNSGNYGGLFVEDVPTDTGTSRNG